MSPGPASIASLRRPLRKAAIETWIRETPCNASRWKCPHVAAAESPLNCAAKAGPSTTRKVHRLMREDNLLCVRRRKFVVTTDSNYGRKIYPNMARSMVLTAMDSSGSPTSPASGYAKSSYS